MKKVIIFLFIAGGGWTFGQNSLGDIIGSVVDAIDNEVIVGAKIKVVDNGAIYQVRTNEEGRFRISAIPAGQYEVSVYYLDDSLKGIIVDVPADGFGNTGTIQYGAATVLTEAVVNSAYTEMRIALTATPCTTLKAVDIAKMPVKFSVRQMVGAMISDVKLDDDGELMFRGARKGDMLYLIDGVKARNMGAMPSAGINSIVVYSGGIPAKYGDTMGGVVVLETKSYFDLLRERN